MHGEPPRLRPRVQVVKGGEGQVVHPVGPVEVPEPEDLVPSGDLYVASHVSSNLPVTRIDRKSTRLNSSHVKISYAVFCLKKKKSERVTTRLARGRDRAAVAPL